MNRPFQSAATSGKVRSSATPSTLRDGRRAPAPGLPIRSGVSSFQPWRLLIVAAILFGCWLLAFSGAGRIDL